MNFKRGRAKNQRAGCLLCKPHKANGCGVCGMQEKRALSVKEELALECGGGDFIPLDAVDENLQDSYTQWRAENPCVEAPAQKLALRRIGVGPHVAQDEKTRVLIETWGDRLARASSGS
jgi:hypothetical protein